MALTENVRDKLQLPSPPAPLPKGEGRFMPSAPAPLPSCRKRQAGEGRRRTRAFTLIELLAVIAIISTLIGILIPAIQSARESGRRTSCQSNLRQIALAVANFDEAAGHFPEGQCGGTIGFGPDTKTWSWMARILPHIEESGIDEGGTIFAKTLRECGVADRRVRLFLCPSDGYSWRGPRTDAGNLDGFAVGQTNYKGVSGANWGADGSQKKDSIGTLWANPGTNGSADGLNDGDGVMWRSDYLRPVRSRRARWAEPHLFARRRLAGKEPLVFLALCQQRLWHVCDSAKLHL